MVVAIYGMNLWILDAHSICIATPNIFASRPHPVGRSQRRWQATRLPYNYPEKILIPKKPTR
jgi:hypothetical protein